MVLLEAKAFWNRNFAFGFPANRTAPPADLAKDVIVARLETHYGVLLQVQNDTLIPFMSMIYLNKLLIG